MKTILSLVLVSLSILVFSSNSNGAAVSFQDNHKYWGDGAGWGASRIWNTDNPNPGWDGNAIDVIGDPEITGGTTDFSSSGRLMSITFNYYAPLDTWVMLAPGSLFINVLKGPGDTTWDYVVKSMANPNIYDISLKGIDAKRLSQTGNQTVADANPNYILSGLDNTGPWSGYYLRNNHPIGVQQTVLNSSPIVGNAVYSGFPVVNGTFNGHPDGSSTYDFSSIDGLDLGGKNIIVGWEMTCANDVIYERVNNPVPEPSTLILLGAGLLGAGLASRKFRK